MIAACLSLVQENKDLSNFAASILLLSLIFPIVAAPFARAAYHRRATRLMKFREVRSPPAAWWERRERHFARSAPAANIEKTTPEAFAGIMRHRLQRIRRATFAAYTTFVVGTGLSVPLHYSADAAEYAIGAAALAIGPVLINATPRTTPRWLILVVAALLTISMVFDPLEDYRAVAVAFGLVFAFYLVATNRTLRALYVPLNILGLGGITGFILGMIAAVVLGGCFSPFIDFGKTGPLSALAGLAWGVVGFTILGIWIANRLIAGLARLHERGWISDISLVSASVMTMGAAMACFWPDRPDVTFAAMTVAWLIWVALTIGAYIVVLRSSPWPEGACSLLMLRVFSHNRRTERLLDQVQTSWRYAGPVLQIGGPDLARLNINPHGFALFLGRGAHELFLPGEVSKERLLSGLDLAPDREGRFRIAEVFCFDSAWHDTVQTLIESSDAILVDLRGFGPQRAGTAFELAQLASRRRLDRTVVIGDATTEWSCFEALVGAEAKNVVRLDAQRRDLVDACITALLQRGVRPAQLSARTIYEGDDRTVSAMASLHGSHVWWKRWAGAIPSVPSRRTSI